MNEFPLAPFLHMLASDGIRVTLNEYERICVALRTEGDWTVARLRGVLLALLVKNADQERLFTRRFDEFFNANLEVIELSDVELEQLWAQLSDLIRAPKISLPLPWSRFKRTSRQEISSTQLQEHRSRLRLSKYRVRSWHVLILIPIFALTVLLWFKYLRHFTDEIPIVNVPDMVVPPPLAPPELRTVRTTTKDFSVAVKEISSPIQLPVKRNWRDPAGVVGLVFFLTLGYAIFLWIVGNLPSRHQLSWNPHGQRHFTFGQLGGKAAPHLDSATLDQLADSLGYFQSDAPDTRLDVRGSVEAMARQGGFPYLVFHKRRQLRTVYVLEDAYAQPLAWNPIPRELAEGLSQRGINVKYGRFHGSPNRFQIEGSVEWLEDMDAQRHNYLLLFFSDSKSLQYRRDSFVLETLARWPLLAWMELRQPRHWDESTALVKHFGLSIFPASSAGLLRAMQHFLTEQSASEDCSEEAREWRGVPANVDSDLTIYIEGLLGDALPWGQACAMIQPVTIGMADALRREFQPQLLPDRIERLFALPGTGLSDSGIRFSVPVLAVLRAGFTVRWPQRKQEEILRFLMEEIAKTEPTQKDSLAHLVWQWTLARVRLELEPDRAIEQIVKLEETPLKGAIKAELENIVLPGASLCETGSTDITRVPLRLKPENRVALAHLARISSKLRKEAEFRLSLVERITANCRQLAGLLNQLRLKLDAFIWRTVEGLEKLKGAKFRGARVDAFTTTLPGAIATQIVACPPKLSFKHLKTKRTYSRRLTLRTVSGDRLVGQASADTDWIRVEPAILDSDKTERLIKVLADTGGLWPGKYEGNVIFISAGSETFVPVTLTVVAPLGERVVAWWRDQPRKRVQLSLVLTASVLAVLFITSILPANWINRLYNTPPALKEVRETERFDELLNSLKFEANTEDLDRDEVVEYAWESDASEIEGHGNSAIINAARIAPIADRAVPEVNLRLKLKDARGGQSAYMAKIILEPKYHERETEIAVPSISIMPETDSAATDPGEGAATEDSDRRRQNKRELSSSELGAILMPYVTPRLAGLQRGNEIILNWPAFRRHTPLGDFSETWLRRVDVYRFMESPGDTLPVTQEEFAKRSSIIGSVIYEQLRENVVTVSYYDVLERELLSGVNARRLYYAIRYTSELGQRMPFSNFVVIDVASTFSEPPTVVSVTNPTENTVKIHWQVPAANVDKSTPVNLLGYNVYRTQSWRNPEQKPINQTPVTTTEFTDQNFEFGKEYTYVVRAVSLGGRSTHVESLNSNSLSIMPRDVFPPSAPMGLTISASSQRISLFFAANRERDVIGYDVFRSTDLALPQPQWRRLGRTPRDGVTFNDDSVEAGTRYYYFVTVIDSAGNASPFSKVVSEIAR